MSSPQMIKMFGWLMLAPSHVTSTVIAGDLPGSYPVAVPDELPVFRPYRQQHRYVITGPDSETR